jgi:NAD+ synthase (glutamine-hydrolysing)
VRVALGQINPTIGDFAGNLALIDEVLGRAERAGADLLVLPELALCGYPPRDLLERPAFIDAASRALSDLVARVGRHATPDGRKTAVIVGFPERLPDTGAGAGRRLANAAAVIDDGRLVSVHRKSLLPTYDVFDEWRYFEPADAVTTTELRGRRLGVSVCEDVWNDADFWPHRLYRQDPIEKLVAGGAEILINISASPYTIEKRHLRPRMLAATARRWGRPLVCVNQVGGQDDLVFDGASLACDERGEVIARAAESAPDLVLVDLAAGRGEVRPFTESDARSALNALVLGTSDYARRCGFTGALVGLSGGIDSAVVACIAARALGPAQVLGVALPSRYSSSHSRDDAEALARTLGLRFEQISIEPVFSAYLDTLAPIFAGRAADTTEENLQARVRGALLMALSNKLGLLLLTTGNKSELATGYCTLYGDMCGGLAVVSDVPKTLVYRLAHEINAERAVIPQSTLTKPPSAELAPNQKDQDTLPPYELLDAILEAHIEQGLDATGLIAAGFPAAVVEDVVRRVRRSEYKRRQMPPGLIITGKAFGPGRRYPIAQAFRGDSA